MYICFFDYEAYTVEPPGAFTSRKRLNIQNTKTFPVKALQLDRTCRKRPPHVSDCDYRFGADRV